MNGIVSSDAFYKWPYEHLAPEAEIRLLGNNGDGSWETHVIFGVRKTCQNEQTVTERFGLLYKVSQDMSHVLDNRPATMARTLAQCLKD